MTNIIVTLWPSSNTPEKLAQLYQEGIRILRFNFPHYNKETAAQDIQTIHEVEKQIKGKFELLLDTEWPQVRTWVLKTPIAYKVWEKFRIVVKESKRGDRDLFCDYPDLIQDAKIGMIIKIDSGLFDVKVIEKGSESLVVQAITSFTVWSRRHVNLPGIHCKLSTITSKDKEDIILAIQNNFSYLAMSFTRSSKDVQWLKSFLSQNKWSKIKIISKIENQEWIDNVDEIIDASDMIMIARGDLWTELPVETIPVHQMNIIKKCKEKNVPVIVATQMLESMIINHVPTRAEVSDIFYAVMEGADDIMLSWETAIGNHPIECVEVMKKVIEQVEKL